MERREEHTGENLRTISRQGQGILRRTTLELDRDSLNVALLDDGDCGSRGQPDGGEEKGEILHDFVYAQVR